jgi:hypothetical protein
MIDANRWQHLIKFSLSNLYILNFKFDILHNNSYNNILIKFQQFQTDFWLKQHHWYTNYEIFYSSAVIYTIPYQRCPWRRGSGRFFKKSSRCVAAAAAADLSSEDIEKVHEFDRISVLTSKTPSD